MGVPARVIGSSIKFKEKCIAMWKNQKPPGWSDMKPGQRAKALKKHLLTLFEDQNG